MAEFVGKGSYFISTDSVLLPSNIDISSDALDSLKSVGSNLKKEFNVDHGVLIKTRLYGLNPFEEDSDKKHIARHSVHMKHHEFIDFLKTGLITHSTPNLEYKTNRLVKYDKHVRGGLPLNSNEIYQSEINPRWDGKRKLDKKVDNPFDDYSWTKPLTSKDVLNNVDRKPAKAKVGRKAGKKIQTNLKQAIVSCLEKGMKQVDICGVTGASKSYVSKVVNQHKLNNDKIDNLDNLSIMKIVVDIPSHIPEIGKYDRLVA